MRFVGYLKKTWIENLRDWKILMFALGFAPCFVVILFMMYGSGNQSYSVALINQDRGIQASQAIELIQNSTFESGTLKYKVILNELLEAALEKLKNKTYDAVGIFPPQFTQTLEQANAKKTYDQSKFTLYGDPQNMRYAVASIYLLTDIDNFVIKTTGYKQPVILDEHFVGKGAALTDFDLYVPGIMAFALLNVIFSAGASLIREVEKGTMMRLILSRLKMSEFIGAIGLVQTLLCVISMMLALGTAMTLGFKIKGDPSVILLIGVLSSVGVMGVALLTVSVLRSVYDLMTVGIVPYFIIMFFGGIFFPLPPLTLTQIGNHAFLLNDLLPLSLSVSALNRVMNFGVGFGDLSYELIGITLVSSVYLSIGLAFFYKRHMRLG